MRQHLIITTTGGPETTFTLFRFFSPGDKCEIQDVFEPIQPTPIEQRMKVFDELAEAWLSRMPQEEKKEKQVILHSLREALAKNHHFTVGFFNPEYVTNFLIIEGMKKQFERLHA